MIICDRCEKRYQEGGITLKDEKKKEVYQLCSDCKEKLWEVLREFLTTVGKGD